MGLAGNGLLSGHHQVLRLPPLQSQMDVFLKDANNEATLNLAIAMRKEFLKPDRLVETSFYKATNL